MSESYPRVRSCQVKADPYTGLLYLMGLIGTSKIYLILCWNGRRRQDVGTDDEPLPEKETSQLHVGFLQPFFSVTV